jgi:hypothetical protein
VRRIGNLYRIEAALRGLAADARLAERQERSAPLIAGTRTWLTHHRARVAGKSSHREALSYIAKYWHGLCVFLADGRIEIDNNTVERTIRPIALNRKNALFAGHDAGAENWATIASLDRNLQAQLRRSVRLPGSHAHFYHQRTQAEPDRPADAMELLAADKRLKSAVDQCGPSQRNSLPDQTVDKQSYLRR